MSVIINDDNFISIDSSKEEVAKFFSSNFNFSKEIIDNFIKEDISGEVLIDLETSDFKLLGLKIGPIKKIQSFLNKNKDKFIPKPINLSININSSSNDVKTFFEKYLNYKESLNNINGKQLFGLSLEEMEKEGLNLGQRKKLSKYIQFAIDKKNRIEISEKSNMDEVAQFLKEELNLSDKAIEEISADGEALYLLTEEDIDALEDSNLEEKQNLKNFLKNEKEKNKENTINEKTNIQKISDSKEIINI